MVPGAPAPAFDLSQWPPAGATPLDVTGAYDRLLERGYAYGPVFQGLKAAWVQGDDVFAEVALPETAHGDAALFGLHPALLDAAMHADLLGGNGAAEGATLLPFSWNGVTLHAAGTSVLRVHIRRVRGDEVSAIMVADETGAPVATVESLVSRPVSEAQLAAASGGAGAALHRVEWLRTASAGAAAAEAAVYFAPVPAGEDAAARVRTVVPEVLAQVQGRLADPESGSAPSPWSPAAVSPCWPARTPIRRRPPSGVWSGPPRPRTPAGSSWSTWPPEPATRAPTWPPRWPPASPRRPCAPARCASRA